MTVFQPFPKVPRLCRDITITEKLDGTNAAVVIVNGEVALGLDGQVLARSPARDLAMFAQSRNRLITPESDNFGFAKWVQANADDLWSLGEGHHFGEWWGQGIQRGYGLTEKRFSLFNTSRWNDETKPACCHVVPVIDVTKIEDPIDFGATVHCALSILVDDGSLAAPGFTNPEGIMVYHHAAKSHFKYTLDGDGHKESKAA